MNKNKLKIITLSTTTLFFLILDFIFIKVALSGAICTFGPKAGVYSDDCIGEIKGSVIVATIFACLIIIFFLRKIKKIRKP